MTIIELSKQQVIEALRVEPVGSLKPGSWIQPLGLESRDEDIDHASWTRPALAACGVCACGAVMRRAALAASVSARDAYRVLDRATSETYVTCTPINAEDVIERGASAINRDYPMNGLSIVFEGLSKIYGRALDGDPDVMILGSDHRGADGDAIMERVRQETIAFVEEHFPDTIIVDINGAEPAVDAKIVTAYAEVY